MSPATCATCPWSCSDGTECRASPPQEISGTDANGNLVRLSMGRATTPDYWCSAHPGRRALLRDNVAAMAMSGLCADSPTYDEGQARSIAAFAYEVADAMLAAAAKERP